MIFRERWFSREFELPAYLLMKFSLDAFFIVGFQDVVEGLRSKAWTANWLCLQGKTIRRTPSGFPWRIRGRSWGWHFDVKEEDVYVRVDVQEVEDFFSVLAFSDDLDAGKWSRVRISVSAGISSSATRTKVCLCGPKAPFLVSDCGIW